MVRTGSGWFSVWGPAPHNPHPDFPSKRNTWLVSDGPLPTAWVRRGAGPWGKTGSEPTDSAATPSDIYFLFSPIFSSELISCCHTSSNSCQDSKKACSEQPWCKYPSRGASTCIALAGYPAAALRTTGTHAAAKQKGIPSSAVFFWDLLLTCPLVSPSCTSVNNTGELKANLVCSMQPSRHTRGRDGVLETV